MLLWSPWNHREWQRNTFHWTDHANSMQGLGNWAGLSCPYHPQSSEKVEKYSGIIKERLAKLMQEWEEGSVKKQLPELFPLVLYNIRITPTFRSENLSSYEILFGGPPKTGLYFPHQTAVCIMIMLCNCLIQATNCDAEVCFWFDSKSRSSTWNTWFTARWLGPSKRTCESIFWTKVWSTLPSVPDNCYSCKVTWIHASHYKKVQLISKDE